MTRMTACAVATLVLVCWQSVAADQFELLLEGHPRLEFAADQIEALRADRLAVRESVAAADRVLERSYTQTYQAYYVSVPSAEFPSEHEDGWPYWTGIAGELRRYMEITSRAYALTGERKYLVWCRELMLSVRHGGSGPIRGSAGSPPSTPFTSFAGCALGSICSGTIFRSRIAQPSLRR
jgi:hypothetical protein